MQTTNDDQIDPFIELHPELFQTDSSSDEDSSDEESSDEEVECCVCKCDTNEDIQCNECKKFCCLDCTEFKADEELMQIYNEWGTNCCLDCRDEQDLYKCSYCEYLYKETEYIFAWKGYSKCWDFKTRNLGETIGIWTDPELICKHCRDDSYNFVRCCDCGDLFDIEKCEDLFDWVMNPEDDVDYHNWKCKHCHYKERKIAMIALERIRKLPWEINRYIVNHL